MKKPDKGHQWLAIISVPVTEEQVKMLDDGKQVEFAESVSKNENEMQVGCYACELPYEVAKTRECKGEARA